MDLEYFRYKYGYEIEGMWFPRVTAITSSFPNGYTLRNNYFKEQIKNAADWGSLVHETIERILKKEKVKIPDHISVSIKAFKKWEKDNSLKISGIGNIEKRVVDFEHGYAGTVDLIAELNGVNGVIDVKTTTTISRQHSLQTAAYMTAYNKENGGSLDDRWILRIDQYKECKGCLAKMRTKYGMEKTQGGKKICNHQWGRVLGIVELKRLENFTKDMNDFLDAKDKWEFKNREWLSKIPNYAKSIQEKIYI